MIRILPLIIIFFASEIVADPCKIEMMDISKTLQSINNSNVLTVSNITDIYSNEPIKRYVQALPNGTIVIVEQKHCLMSNLTITMLLPDGHPFNKIPDQLSKTLDSTVIWKKWFEHLDATKILKNEFSSKQFLSNISKPGDYSYSLDNKISSKNNTSEALLRIINLDSGSLPFNVIISLNISAGGL